jgi:hypothetical protein
MNKSFETNTNPQQFDRLIGLTGFAQSGKDESAKYLIAQDGYTRIAFADKLRATLYGLNPLVIVPYEFVAGLVEAARATGDLRAMYLIGGGAPYMNDKDTFKIVGLGHRLYRLRDLVDAVGWDEAKKVPEVRQLLQRNGTEAGRKIFGESFWIDQAFASAGDAKKVIVTDVRFDNEAEAVRDRGGVVIAVQRAGVGPVNDHASDRGIRADLVDAYIFNLLPAGSQGTPQTLAQLHKDVRSVVEHIFGASVTA